MILLDRAGNVMLEASREALARAAAISHATVWLHSPIKQDGQTSKCLVFITVNEQVAAKAFAALAAAGVLCETDLGPMKITASPGSP